MAAKLFLSSTTTDADLFLIVRVFDPDNNELTFMGSTDPHTPIANGWLRASHRALDPERTLPYRPYHPHDHVDPLTPGEVVECDVEIVTSCIVVPPGWRVAFTVRGKDYEYDGELDEFDEQFHYSTRGTGGMTHNDPDNRPPKSSAAPPPSTPDQTASPTYFCRSFPNAHTRSAPRHGPTPNAATSTAPVFPPDDVVTSNRNRCVRALTGNTYS